MSNWAKVSPRRRTSMARQLCPSVAVATQPTGRSTPTVISPSLIKSAMLDRGTTAEFFATAFWLTLRDRLGLIETNEQLGQGFASAADQHGQAIMSVGGGGDTTDRAEYADGDCAIAD